MAYNPYLYTGVQPAPTYGYQPYGQFTQEQMAQYRQQQMQQTVTPGQNAPAAALPDDRIWVQGEVAATSWPVTANGFVRLWDSTAHVFYEKRADAQGKPLPMEIFDYTRRGGEPVEQRPENSYEDRLKNIEDRLTAIETEKDAGKKKEEKA